MGGQENLASQYEPDEEPSHGSHDALLEHTDVVFQPDAIGLDYPLVSELTAEGVQVLRCITESITTKSEKITPSLKQLLLESLKSYQPAVLNQLGLLLEAPVFPANENQKGHWQYELTMVRAVLEHSKIIQKMFDCSEELLVDLCFMIIVSDIGKAGPISAVTNGPEAVVYRIFTQAIFFEDHSKWLKAAYDPSSPDLLKPDAFPPELAPVLANISREPKENGAPSDFSMIFQSGIFLHFPLKHISTSSKRLHLKKPVMMSN